jgi:Dolichyl-phosphate-mannose-protein mannosyltransferase
VTAVSWIVAVAVLAATAHVLGRRVAGWPGLGLSFQDRLERDAVSTALGLALLAHLLLLLGLAGLLRPWPVLLLTAAIHVSGFPVWRERIQGIRPRPAWLLAALALPLCLLALYPPTGFDATMYHLPFARTFAESGGVSFLPDLRFPVFPQANEILFAAAMLFGGDVAAQGVQLFAALLTAGLLVAWGRGVWNPAAGWLAAAVFLGNPVVVHLAGTAYIEPGLALFITAGIFALDRWRRGGGRGWLALAAAFTATAADVKYLGLFFLGVAGLMAIFAVRSRPAEARFRDALLFSAVAAAFLAPWYLRIYVHTGNPLFPYLPGLFGTSLWTAKMSPDPGELDLGQLVRWVRLPWDLVFERQRSGGQPPFSPVYLTALPLLAARAFRDSRVRFLLLIAGAFGLAWTRLPPDSRYLMAVLPLASLAVAGAAAPWIGRSRRWAAILCLGCFLPGWLYAGYRIQRQGPPPVTAERREAYLARALPVYPALAHLNRTRGSGYTVWALYAESMVYFAEGRFLGDWVGPASFPRVLAGARDAGSFHGALRRTGATHLLIPTRLANGGAVTPPVPEDAAFRRWFRLVYRDPGARVYELK